MRKLILSCVLSSVALILTGQSPLSYYMPKHISFDPEITTPTAFIGHEVGEWHLSHDKLYYYMLELARESDKAVWETYANSYEGRPLGNLIISSAENIKNIEQIRTEHVRLSDPSVSGEIDITDMPVIIKLGYGVHGNESSAQNSSVLIAYYLIAGLGDELDNLLDNAVILVDPCLNPDGFQRHSTWVNMHKSENLNPDANSREFREAWPGGRTNHYWFDLNRDYIMLQHPESVGRVEAFHKWKPNINTDHHEMGASSSFFFQPGVRTRENPLTPDENYELVTEIATYHQKYLDKIGSLYYSEENFDDFYLGKGSAYPDIHASVGILFEQAGVKGHLRETSSGIISFPFAIRNQFAVSLSSLEAGLDMRTKLLQHQVDFYQDAIQLAENDPVKAYVFSEPADKARAAHMIENLLHHQIKIYRLSEDINSGDRKWSAKDSYVIPLKQAEYRYIKSMFIKVNSFEENVFYDISSWNIPMSFNIPYTEYKSSRSVSGICGPEIIIPPFAEGSLLASRDAYAYVFEWDEYYTPAALYKLLEAGINARVATENFEYDDGELKKAFSYGSIMIPAYNQVLDRDSLYELMKEIISESKINIYGLNTGHTVSGIDLGSSKFSILKKPEIMMFVGSGVRSGDAGEIWHLFDQRYGMPVTMIDAEASGSISLEKYNVIIIAGTPSLTKVQLEELKGWTRKGGTIIAYKGGSSFIARNELAEIDYIPAPKTDSEGMSYAERSSLYSVHRIPGSIFEVKLDISHPLCYGYKRSVMPVFKNGSTAVTRTENTFANPIVYTNKPLLSGYSSDENIDRVAGSAFASIHPAGRGRIISLYDNTNFRAIWFGTTKVFMNAVFFRDQMR